MRAQRSASAKTQLTAPSREEFFLDLAFRLEPVLGDDPRRGPASPWRFVTRIEQRIGPDFDAILEISWGGHKQRYVCDYRARSTPQSLDRILLSLKSVSAERQLPPLVIVPYLSEEALLRLERDGVSGIDLSGNGAILAPDFSIWRSGQPNRFTESQPIRNIYRGNSSLFARCFLLRGAFPTLSSLRTYAQHRLSLDEHAPPTSTKLTMSTASKVVKALEEELIVRTTDSGLTLIDGETLLARLQTNYRPPEGRRIEGKTALNSQQVWQRLAQAAQEHRPEPDPARRYCAPERSLFRYVTTGLGSAAKYHVLSGPDKLSLYVSELDAVIGLIEFRETRAFPNVELIEEKDDSVYFDARREDDAIWASPVQTWLELATGGPRERDAAQSLRAALARSHGEAL